MRRKPPPLCPPIATKFVRQRNMSRAKTGSGRLAVTNFDAAQKRIKSNQSGHTSAAINRAARP